MTLVALFGIFYLLKWSISIIPFQNNNVNLFESNYTRANANNKTSEVSDDEGISTGNKGIIIHGNGKDSDGKLLNYAPETEKSRIHVTTDAHEIIILRYYRDRQPEGKYNVIHVYYLRDENGDQWEGTSGILPQKGELGIKYIRTEADTIPIFQPKNAKEPYTYTWDKRPQYGIISKESIRFSVIKKSRYIHCSEFDSFLLYQIAINFLIISL